MVARDTPNVEVPGSSPGFRLMPGDCTPTAGCHHFYASMYCCMYHWHHTQVDWHNLQPAHLFCTTTALAILLLAVAFPQRVNFDNK